MQLDRRKELILKALPERKKTSKKLKQQVFQDIYNRASSLPQKKSLNIRQNQSSVPKRYSELKMQSEEILEKQNDQNPVQQKQSILSNKRVQRKNHSLPKQLHPRQKIFNLSTQILLPNTKKSDNQKTKVKKFSQKQERSSLTESQQKYRLKTLEDILKKKDSKRLIRQSFLHYNIKNSPTDRNPQQKLKTKQNKMINMKQAFENRKFTNLSKYKMSTGSRNNNIFGQNKTDDRRQSNYISRKVSKQNSRKRIKTSQNEKIELQSLSKQERTAQRRQKLVIKDLDLAEYIDSQNMVNEENRSKVLTLEDSFQEASDMLGIYESSKKMSITNMIDKEDKMLQICLQLLKNVERQTGSLSRKTSLLLGKVYFYLGQFNNAIYHLENVFKESNYDLLVIHSLKQVQKQQNFHSFISDFYFVLGESYKKTQNFLCTIKILDEWQLNVVNKILDDTKDIKNNQKSLIEKNRIQKLKAHSRQNTIQQDDEIESEQNWKQLQDKKRSHSILRQNTETHYLSEVKQKQRTHSLIRRQTLKYKTQQLNLKPRSKHLSIKTLSEINVNLDSQNRNKVIREEELKQCKQRLVFKYGYLMRARINFQIKNFYASIQDYQRTLACDSSNVEAGLQLATLYYKIGRKDKSVSFLQDFLKQIKQALSDQPQSIQQVKYHLAVMIYKNQRYQDSLSLLQTMEKEGKNLQFEGQIYFYEALNLIKIKKIFSYHNNSSQSLKEKQRNKSVDDILICLQKSIDLCSSEFYVYAAYFLRIYMFIFHLKHYYGAQYEIDRLKASIQRKKMILKKQKGRKYNEKQVMDYRNVSVEFFAKIINLNDLIQITSGIICVLKLKFLKGLQLIGEVEKKVRFNKEILNSDIISLQNTQIEHVNEGQQKYQASQILKLLYQFKYYGLYTMRKYCKALGYLQRIKQIDRQSEKQSKIQLRINEETQLQSHLHFKDESDRINYLTVQSLILIEEKKFEDALNMVRIIEREMNDEQGRRLKTHKKTKSGNLDTISTVMEIKKQANGIQIIKSLCYILLYKYLESQKNQQPTTTIEAASRGSLKIQVDEGQQQNEQILLVGEDLLSQCLICDQENFQILFLIALIHYELKRYDSALNYIRQAIELSDDHMIKHYYLKANMKLFLGKYEEAIKDYSNAITVFKEFEKEKEENSKPMESELNSINQKTISVQDNLSFESRCQKSETLPNESAVLTNRSQTSRENQNEYYEEEQQMHPEIYLNRGIAYLKHAYSLQYGACHYKSRLNSQQKHESYQQVRENIINLKSAAGQDIKHYFNQLIKKYKAQLNTKTTTNTENNNQTDLLYQTIQKSPKRNSKTPTYSTINSSKDNNSELIKLSPYLHFLLHTSDLESMLEISRSFSKEFNCKLLTDQELMRYFYLAKQLNNCLTLMDKMIKKHYLSEKNTNQHKPKQNQLKKYSSSKAVEPVNELQPYFKSKRQYKMSRANNFSQFNVQKYSTKQEQSEKSVNEKQTSLKSKQQKIQRLVSDKKILSALKDSSNNGRQDYENALVNLLQEEQNLRKLYPSNEDGQQIECGNIFKFGDLLFFIGVMYFMLQDYESSVRYFERSYNLKRESQELYSLRSVVSRQAVQEEQQSGEYEDGPQLDELAVSNLSVFEQIYDNRIFSKEEIQYNMGVANLMAGEYNVAYEYLEKYDNFVNLIENIITDVNQEDRSNKNASNPLAKKSKHSHKETLNNQNSFDNVSVKTKSHNESNPQSSDITPFPTHNRLCSIYPPKEINGVKFSLSFCLPKLQLPSLGIFHPDQIQIAQQQKLRKRLNSSVRDYVAQMNEKETIKTLPNFNETTDLLHTINNDSRKFFIQKQKIVNFLDIVTLKDIAMKPVAPWIKKDKEKKCIRFTDNFLSQSFDLKTQCTTERRPKNSSRKEMFGQQKNNHPEDRNYEKNNQSNGKSKDINLQRKHHEEKGHKRVNDPNYNFLKAKQKQKQTNKRYETIEHE